MVENSQGVPPNNVQGPCSKNTRETANEPDPEQFKRAMKKVGKSGESEQKNKSPSRNKQTRREESKKPGSDDTACPPPPRSSTPFAEFMSDDKGQGSILDSESAGIQVQTHSQQDSPLTMPPPSPAPRGEVLNRGAEPPPSPKGESSSSTSPPPQPSSNENEMTQHPSPPSLGQSRDEQGPSHPPPPTTPPSHETSYQEQAQPGERDPSTPSGAQPSQREKEKPPSSSTRQKPSPKPLKTRKSPIDSSLLVSQTPSGALKVRKSPAKRGTPRKKLIPVKSKNSTTGVKREKGGPASKEKYETQKSPRPGTKRGGGGRSSSFSRNTPTALAKGTPPPSPRKTTPTRGKPAKPSIKRVEEPRSKPKRETAIRRAPIHPVAESGSSAGKETTKKNTHKPLEEHQGAVAAPLPEGGLLPPPPPLDSGPVYLRLPQDLFELVEKIGGTLMILHQQNHGITETTVTLNIPSSILDGTQVLIKEYDTAPKSFNIQLISNPEAVELFNSYMSQLNNAFQQANYNFEVRLLNPILTERKKSPHMIRRKGAAGEDSGDREGQSR